MLHHLSAHPNDSSDGDLFDENTRRQFDGQQKRSAVGESHKFSNNSLRFRSARLLSCTPIRVQSTRCTFDHPLSSHRSGLQCCSPNRTRQALWLIPFTDSIMRDERTDRLLKFASQCYSTLCALRLPPLPLAARRTTVLLKPFGSNCCTLKEPLNQLST